MPVPIGDISWERMIQAMEDVRDRLMRATRLLEAAGIPYAVVGGNAVAAWVSRVDKAAVRNTQDVDILLRRHDLPAAQVALEAGGFVHRHSAGIDMFLDGPEAKFRDAVHILFANEKVRQEYETFNARRVRNRFNSDSFPSADSSGFGADETDLVSPTRIRYPSAETSSTLA